MKKVSQRIDERLDQLEKKFSEFRQLKPNRAFPQEIWQEVVELAKVVGIKTLSNRLKLHRGRLKYRIANEKVELPSPAENPNHEKKLDDAKLFLEVPMSPFTAASKEPGFQFKLHIHFGVKVFRVEWA